MSAVYIILMGVLGFYVFLLVYTASGRAAGLLTHKSSAPLAGPREEPVQGPPVADPAVSVCLVDVAGTNR